MRALLLRWILAVVALFLTATLLRGYGVQVDSIGWAFVVVVVLALGNALVRPLLFLLKVVALPLNLLTLGVFGFVLSLAMNIFVFYLVGCGWRGPEVEGWVPGFRVVGLPAAALGALVMSVINACLLALVPDRRGRGAIEV